MCSNRTISKTDLGFVRKWNAVSLLFVVVDIALVVIYTMVGSVKFITAVPCYPSIH